jgi:nucleoside-diphosphate-sugar epimerase
MNILVIGAAGMVGRKLCDALAEKSFEEIILAHIEDESIAR